MLSADFDFWLPGERIAQSPAPLRDHSRLLVLRRGEAQFEHCGFLDLLRYLRKGDVLVLNDSKVIPARLHGFNVRWHGRFEILLLEEQAVNDWWVMIRPGKRARLGSVIELQDKKGNCTGITATVVAVNAEGHRRLRFSDVRNLAGELDRLGHVPLPLYIHRSDASNESLDHERYQTVYAHAAGSVAAPTAGLHFTNELLAQLRSMGVELCFVTLHIGLGTFAPVKAERIENHVMHEERYEVSSEAAATIESARSAGRRIVAVGTTSVRVLESAVAIGHGRIVAGRGRTSLFIRPPARFAVVDGLLTNFHLPRSTLLMLVSAFCAPESTAGRELVLRAYREAVRLQYRFFSYGDAMLIL